MIFTNSMFFRYSFADERSRLHPSTWHLETDILLFDNQYFNFFIVDTGRVFE
ncbi:hypothetical protein HanPSC8_Chr02g0069001 [Helianthus annuus]|nr:hypothetical protein HanPSC8_Chr02g0069001 [Helianthus annuus]